MCEVCGALLAPVAPRRHERRRVSALFADLVGFTGISEQLDIEDVEALLSRYHEVVRAAVEEHGGAVVKLLGDGAMAVFGAPVAHEDDAERAVRAALAIQDAFAAERAAGRTDLHVRIGVHTGEALLSLGEGIDLFGDTINTAQRLQAAADPDGILVGDSTRAESGYAIAYAPAEAVDAHGKRRPVQGSRVLGARSPAPQAARPHDLPLVGRRAELDILVEALRRSRAGPQAHLVTVVGAPGIGKTRLIAELAAEAAATPQPVSWRHGRSLAYGERIAHWALGEIVKEQAGILDSDTAEVVVAKLGGEVAGLIAERRTRAWVTGHLRPLVGLEALEQVASEGHRVESFAAWRRFFEAVADRCPAVLVFEDLQWADDGLLDFLELLADRAGKTPLLLLCSARPELLDRRPAWASGGHRIAVRLAPLPAPDTTELLSLLLREAHVPAAMHAELLGRVEGNPLYAREFVRMLLDRGLLVHGDDGWRLTGPIAGLPESVQGIIAARLDTLSAEERALVQDAAVIGRTAWLGATCELSGRPLPAGHRLVTALERRQLIELREPSGIDGEIEFAFSHALTQEVAYARINRADRADRHERVAGWIGRLSGGREDKLELLAHHYTSALRLRRELGRDDPDLAARARDALIAAGRRAAGVDVHATAAAHLAGALELTSPADPARTRLLLDHAAACLRCGRADETMLREALAAQIRARRWEDAAEAAHLLGQWAEDYTSDGLAADHHIARAARYAGRVSHTPLESVIAGRQAHRLVVTGRPRDAERLAETAIARADAAGDEQGRAILRVWHGTARIVAGRSDVIAEMAEGAATLARSANAWTPTAYHHVAAAMTAVGDLDASREARLESLVWAERFGEERQIGIVRAACAESAYHAGEWAQAFAETEELRGHSSRTIAAQARWAHGMIALIRGGPAEALADARDILDYAGRTENGEQRLVGLSLQSLALWAAGRDGEAAEACRQFFDQWRIFGSPWFLTPALAELALVPGQSTPLAAAAAAFPRAWRWKAALQAVSGGRPADAARLYGDIGSRPLAAAAHLVAARQAAAEGSSGGAARHLEHAAAFYRTVGGESWTDRASVAAASGRPRPGRSRRAPR